MTSKSVRTAAAALCVLFAAENGFAQRGGGDWMTSGFDAQRSNWVRNDAKISPTSMKKPGFEFIWKLDLAKKPRQLNSLTPPALIDFYIGYRGFRTLGFLSTSTDNVVGIDTDLARIEWEKSLPSGAGSTVACPGGITSAVTRPTIIAYPPAPTGRGAGRGNPAKSGVGEPFEGAVTLKRVVTPAPAPPKPATPPPSAGARRVTEAPSPFAPRAQYVYAISGDGKLHSMYISNGEEPKPAVQFLPANSTAQGLLVFDNNAYVSTSNSCGGSANGVWALNLESQKVSQWKADGNVAGSAGPAVGPDGTLYITTDTGKLTALEEGTLASKGAYSLKGAKFTSSPVVFEFNGKNLIAATSNDGRLHLVDSANLTASLAQTPAFSSADFATGALASWQDLSGTRWILAPAAGSAATNVGFTASNGNVTNGTIAAWKVVNENGNPALKPGWVSRDLTTPLTPIIVNGVIFAVSSGEFRTNDAKATAAQRAQKSVPAVLYALDSETGKELWNSGKTITSFVHSGGLSAGGSRVYVASYDGTQFVFGFPIEH